MPEYVDVLVVGAGISGIAAAYYLGKRCPRLSWTILEGRDAIGGTWDRFRFPGVRSDSDMYTLGYRFRPWRGERAIADGPAILQYIRDTAREFGIDSKIRFGHRVCRVEWSSQAAEWIAEIERPALGERLQIRCRFLFMCTGYYRYDQGFTPDWRGRECFRGAVAHPQDWGHSAIGDDLDYDGKRVVLIGSGATAVTMIPVLAQRARHVTMLQRSPTYVVSGPSRDDVSLWLQKHLPFGFASWLARWRLILRSLFYFQVARRRPRATRANMLAGIREALGPDFDVERHFAPRYNPWDQRVCLAPDGDFFKAIKAGAVSIATDEIERFVEDGILLKSGERLAADVIITATGLRMKIMHGVDIVVDGKALALGETISYKGIMYSNIPNLASSFGYTNASWTLKAELICEYVCRLLNYMARRGYKQCRPRLDGPAAETEAYIDFSSGYVQRALAGLPKQGTRRPWRVYQNYLKDLLALRYGPLNDGVMEYR